MNGNLSTGSAGEVNFPCERSFCDLMNHTTLARAGENSDMQSGKEGRQWITAWLAPPSAPKLPMKHICALLLICLAMLGPAACGKTQPPAYETVAPAGLSLGSPIPAPSEEVILTLLGALQVTNAGDTLVFDLSTLEQLGLVEYTVNDPWEKTDITYRGVLLSDLLKFVGVSDAATTLHFVALDNYEVDIPLDNIQKWPILLALQADGEYLNIERGGPTRIIFPYHAYPELAPLTYDPLWIWNIATIEVK